jgi:redox-sensitive bicupin YhaK (pirin superfamily)
VSRVVQTVQTYEGAGFPVRRPFPTQSQADFDPFLLLDHLGPVDYAPGEAKGAPDHPHRGFETVTYVLEGRMEHKDSAGNSGKLGPGDVQWMTAGAGVVHSEMPEEAFLRSGGKIHGFQLWVNLPRKDKMITPRYQDTPAAKIPVATSEDGSVRVKVVAGEALGKRAVIDTRTPITYLHFTLQPGAKFSQPAPKEHNAFAYLISGRGRFGANAREAKEGEAVFFASGGESIAFENADAKLPLNLLLISGVPLREPVARYGPFVMNTREEIYQAFDDFQSGRMGQITH